MWLYRRDNGAPGSPARCQKHNTVSTNRATPTPAVGYKRAPKCTALDVLAWPMSFLRPFAMLAYSAAS